MPPRPPYVYGAPLMRQAASRQVGFATKRTTLKDFLDPPLVAVVTTSDVFLFSCRERHLIALRTLFDKRWQTPHTASMYVPGADY